MDLPCGHDDSLAILAVEGGRFLYCELCDTRARRNDAEKMEEQLRSELAAARSELSAYKQAVADFGSYNQFPCIDCTPAGAIWIRERVAELLAANAK